MEFGSLLDLSMHRLGWFPLTPGKAGVQSDWLQDGECGKNIERVSWPAEEQPARNAPHNNSNDSRRNSPHCLGQGQCLPDKADHRARTDGHAEVGQILGIEFC